MSTGIFEKIPICDITDKIDEFLLPKERNAESYNHNSADFKSQQSDGAPKAEILDSVMLGSDGVEKSWCSLPEGNNQYFLDYKVLSIIGEGSQATVFKAEVLPTKSDSPKKPLKTNKFATKPENPYGAQSNDSDLIPSSPKSPLKIAIKRYPRSTREIYEKDILSILQNEISILGDINSPYVLKPYKKVIYRNEKHFFVLLELIEGAIELSDFVKRHIGKVNEKPSDYYCMIYSFMRQVIVAMKELRKRGVLHRDLKPANILINKEQTKIILIDFGCSSFRKTKDGSSKSRESPIQGGTPIYTAPEIFDFGQSSKKRVSDEKSDIWSVGLIFYYFFQGENPYEGCSSEAEIFQMMKTKNGKTLQIDGKVPQKFKACIREMLEFDPFKRISWSTIETYFLGDLSQEIARKLYGQYRPSNSSDSKIAPLENSLNLFDSQEKMEVDVEKGKEILQDDLSPLQPNDSDENVKPQPELEKKTSQKKVVAGFEVIENEDCENLDQPIKLENNYDTIFAITYHKGLLTFLEDLTRGLHSLAKESSGLKVKPKCYYYLTYFSASVLLEYSSFVSDQIKNDKNIFWLKNFESKSWAQFNDCFKDTKMYVDSAKKTLEKVCPHVSFEDRPINTHDFSLTLTRLIRGELEPMDQLKQESLTWLFCLCLLATSSKVITYKPSDNFVDHDEGSFRSSLATSGGTFQRSLQDFNGEASIFESKKAFNWDELKERLEAEAAFNPEQMNEEFYILFGEIEKSAKQWVDPEHR